MPENLWNGDSQNTEPSEPWNPQNPEPSEPENPRTLEPEKMLVSDFHFDLPNELIAQEPLPRGESRLLAMDRRSGEARHLHVGDLPSLLRAGDLLVVNDTRVFAARLLGHRVPSGGAVECLLLGPAVARDPDGSSVYDALVHPGQKLKPGARMRFEGVAGALSGEILEQRFFGRRRVRISAEPSGSVRDPDALIDAIGHVPLPPYIKRRRSRRGSRALSDGLRARSRVGRRADGRAALHGRAARGDRRARRRSDRRSRCTSATARSSRCASSASRIMRSIRSRTRFPRQRRPLIASRARRGPPRHRRRHDDDARARGCGGDAATASCAPVEPRPRSSSIPATRFRVVDGLLTNFHLPQSSLLMLVAAFAGRERVLAAYREAVQRRYRFYSYGDAMLDSLK